MFVLIRKCGMERYTWISCAGDWCRVEVRRKWNHVTVSKEANSTLTVLGETLSYFYRESMFMKTDNL